ncbi:nuclear transport factor 2 family protein [uncultured Psychromonas sp.]|uniref:nuclear transport factor 2 family protein n=1 Tax=uncultured Psychromonas sp. TaxID=173974 RepID=UPI002601AD4C|nr:nuclear transport factor 2 family protein [uncultured Psychromonas sp.]
MNNEPDWLNEFTSVYQKLNTDNLALLNSIYHQEITFIDPIHEIKGLDELQQYFQGLYQNLESCQFIISEVISQPNQAAIYWKMTYQHPKLNKGNEVSVFGSSHLKAKEGKVIYHRDFLDLGSMLYEQLPVLGKVIRLIKSKAAK